jgi:hypothetical protein
MKTVTEFNKNQDFRDHRLKNDAVEGTCGKALGTVVGH